MKKPLSIVAQTFFFSIVLAAQTAPKQKSRTIKSPLMQEWVPYSPKQKHVLLFRKSDFFKVSNTNMPHIFFRNKTFLFVKIERFWR